MYGRCTVAAFPNQSGGRIKPVEYSPGTIQYYSFTFDNSAQKIQTTLRMAALKFQVATGAGRIMIACIGFRHA
jgi:hypothetical protein